MNWSIPIKNLYVEENRNNKELFFEGDKTAIHSGKLGDIIYSLPAIKSLGVNHLVLNTFVPHHDPLRIMTYKSCRSLVPLLLQQPYLRKVSISECNIPMEFVTSKMDGIHFNFDQYRNVARHRVNDPLEGISPLVVKNSINETPVHLAQMFAASQGIGVDLRTPWLNCPKNPEMKNKILVSITHRWRTYPNWYWEFLLLGLENICAIGLPSDEKLFSNTNLKWIQAKDHAELASWISGCQLFLGTISFPYAIAESLKVNRAVEVCFSNLNAFPIGPQGDVLPQDILQARDLVANKIGLPDRSAYRKLTHKLRSRLPLVFRRSRQAIEQNIKQNTLPKLRQIRTRLGSKWRRMRTR